jgi:hypothetical protein
MLQRKYLTGRSDIVQAQVLKSITCSLRARARQDVYARALNRTLNSLVLQMVQDDSGVFNKDAPFTVNNLEPRTLHMVAVFITESRRIMRNGQRPIVRRQGK